MIEDKKIVMIILKPVVLYIVIFSLIFLTAIVLKKRFISVIFKKISKRNFSMTLYI